jgi:uncharacterized UPF0160 family protein
MFKFNFHSLRAISFSVSTFNQKKMTTQEGCEFKSSLTISYKSVLETVCENRRLRVESAYAEQIEKELRKSILLFPQFYHFEALRRFSRNLEGIL